MAGERSTYRTLIIVTISLFVVAILFSALRRPTVWRSEGSWNVGHSTGIGVVDIEGFIGSSEATIRLIEEYAERDNILGILININSPGGITVSSDEIYRALVRARETGKPIVAYMGIVAASGGYYIACAADTIVAHPASTTGSIGVIIEYPVAAELFDKIGLRWETVTTGPYKSMGSPYAEPDERHRIWFQEVVDDSYEQFLEVVRESRGLEEETLLQYADGRVFTGRQAAEWGFADRTGDLHDARGLIGRMTGLGSDPRLHRPARPRRVTLWDVILGEGIADLATELGLGPVHGPRVLWLMR